MARKILLIVFLGLFSLSLAASEAKPTLAKDGYALLDMVIAFFHDMAMTGTGGKDSVGKGLEDIMAAAKKTYSDGQVDPVFFRRFNRLMSIFKLSIVEDSEGILGPLISRELSEFVTDVKGEKPEVLTGTKAIGIIADALAEEIINLHIYLDNIKEKARLRKEFDKKFAVEKKE